MIQTELDGNGRLSLDAIKAAITHNQTFDAKYNKNEKYYKGENTKILTSTTTLGEAPDQAVVVKEDETLPDNRVPVPFARKISLTTEGYLFSGPVGYETNDEMYKNELDDILYINDNQEKANEIGRSLIVHGKAYKLFYIEVVAGKKVAKYAFVPLNKGVPIYNVDIEPKLIAFIRYYTRTNLGTNESTDVVEVYYARTKIVYIDDGEPKETAIDFSLVPAAIYGGDYRISVFDPVLRLIDSLDIIISSNMNEIQRFEALYLILKGMKMPDDDAEFKKVIERKILELSENGSAEYLQKNIDPEFTMSLYDRIVELIHNMSSVPDFMSKEFAAESGVALLYKLIGFEQLSAGIEAEFLKGEMQSLDIINSVLYSIADYDRQVFFQQNPDRKVKVSLPRNLPEDIGKKLDDAAKMQTVGVSKETILQSLPFIEDAAEEIKKSNEEKKQNMIDFQASQNAGQDDDGIVEEIE